MTCLLHCSNVVYLRLTRQQMMLDRNDSLKVHIKSRGGKIWEGLSKLGPFGTAFSWSERPTDINAIL